MTEKAQCANGCRQHVAPGADCPDCGLTAGYDKPLLTAEEVIAKAREAIDRARKEAEES